MIGGYARVSTDSDEQYTSYEAQVDYYTKFMNEEHWYETTFEDKTGLDKMNFSRVQSGTHKFTKKPLVAMGVGLGLALDEMEEVLQHGGMGFIEGDPTDEAYKYLFTGFYGKGIDECNAFLKEVGIETLGTKERY